MRVWEIKPERLCRKHILGEHVEIHAIWSIINNRKEGYKNHPEVNRWRGKLKSLFLRHEELVKEMEKRGYSHKSVIRLCSFGFSTEENTLLRETLFNNFGLISKPFYSNKQKQYEGIALRGDQANMFLDIINPFLSGTGLEYKGGIK